MKELQDKLDILITGVQELTVVSKEGNQINKTHMRWLIWTVIALALGRGGMDMIKTFISKDASAEVISVNK